MAVVGLFGALAALWFEEQFALFVWLVGSGLGLPPGEDLLVASIGAVLANGDLAAWIAIPMAVVSVVLSDTALFSSGRLAQSTLADRASWIADRTLPYVDLLMGRSEALAIAIARFVPGLRTLVFVSAGLRGVSHAKFVAVDACAAIVWVPLVMTCGAAIVSFLFGQVPAAVEARI